MPVATSKMLLVEYGAKIAWKRLSDSKKTVLWTVSQSETKFTREIQTKKKKEKQQEKYHVALMAGKVF